MKTKLSGALCATLVLLLLWGCGAAETLTQNVSPQDGASVGQTSEKAKKQARKARIEECANSSLDVPIPAGEEAMLLGYSPISGKTFQLSVQIDSYLNSDDFSKYLIRNFCGYEIDTPPSSAIKLISEVFEYDGDVLPYVEDMLSINVITQSGRFLDLIRDDAYNYGLDVFTLTQGMSSTGWLCPSLEPEDKITALKITTKSANGVNNEVYMALPKSDPAALLDTLADATSISIGEDTGSFTILKASDVYAAYSSVRGYQYCKPESGEKMLSILLNYYGEPIQTITDIYAYGFFDGQYLPRCYLYLETDDGKDFLTEWTTSTEKRNLVLMNIYLEGVDPSAEGPMQVFFKVGNKQYVCDYQLGEPVGAYVAANAGDSFTVENVAQIKFKKVFYSDKVKPAKSGGTYTFYGVNDRKTEIFLAIEFQFTNLAETAVAIGDVCGVSIVDSSNESEYIGFIARQSKNGRDLGAGVAVEPNETVRAFAIMKLPKEVSESDARAYVSVDYTDYVFDVPANKK